MSAGSDAFENLEFVLPIAEMYLMVKARGRTPGDERQRQTPTVFTAGNLLGGVLPAQRRCDDISLLGGEM